MVHGVLLANNFEFFIVRTAPEASQKHLLQSEFMPPTESSSDDEVAWASFDIQVSPHFFNIVPRVHNSYESKARKSVIRLTYQWFCFQN